MKNPIFTKFFLCGLLFLIFSCSDDSEILNENEGGATSISFSVVLDDLVSGREAVKQQLENIPECSEGAPAFVEVVVSHSGEPVAGTFLQPLRLTVGQDDNGVYFTQEDEELELVAGMYTLDYFRVLDENLQVIWIAPREEEGEVNFANLVDAPLPMEIDLRSGTKKYLEVDVICYDNRLVNYYGYLFFELDGSQAIEFCIFGNFCDESGRHIEAVSYTVSVWKYSGNELNPKGAILHEDLQNAVIVEDDFENQTSVTYALPLCIALPDTSGEDQYYFEITLLGEGNPLIRSGVITDDDVRSLFDGEDNVEYYHFREGNCNLGDSPDLFEEVTGESPVALFLPALESLYGSRGASEWVHEYDQNGLLIKSMLYELYPYRLLWEFEFSGHDETGVPYMVDRSFYNRGNVTRSTVEYTYVNNRINMALVTDEDGNFISKSFAVGFDDANRVTETLFYTEGDQFESREIREFDAEGRIAISTTYSSEFSTDQSNIIRRDENTYTSFGDIHISKQLINGVERELEYFYRENNTLEELRSVEYQDEPVYTVIKFDENEVRISLVSTRGNYRVEHVALFEDLSPRIVHYYHYDFLYRVVTYNDDRSSQWKIINESDNSYRIEYKDASGNIYKTEYYSPEGELISEES